MKLLTILLTLLLSGSVMGQDVWHKSLCEDTIRYYANKPVKDSFPHTDVPDSVYISKPTLPMKIDTIQTDTVGFERIGKHYHDSSTDRVCVFNTFGCSIGSHKYIDSIWTPILKYITDTTYILTPEQVKIQEILLSADKKKKLWLVWFNGRWYASSYGGIGIYRTKVELDSLIHLCSKKHCPNGLWE